MSGSRSPARCIKAMVEQHWALSIAAAAASASLSIALILLIKPLLHRHLVAHPNARSAHKVATPQGAGIAVTLSVALVSAVLGAFWDGLFPPGITSLLAAALGLMILGAADDAKDIAVVWRLLGQVLAAIAIVLTLPPDVRVLPDAVPLLVERTLVVIGSVWLINAVNFLDGLDWMTVVEVVPITLAVAMLQSFGLVPPGIGLLAFALLGAMVGFAAFNKHPATIFLGDAGSLPIGLCLAYMLIYVAASDLTAALLLALYILADATVTLTRRAAAGESILTAHRSHFYQRAVVAGLTVPQVTARVFILGMMLAFFAVTAALTPSLTIDLILLLGGASATALTLYRLGQGR
jgi:UDP-N-acetylmuramyl pentapeptide phosphotransferase/UDP-N-acetylglucosamine-1-phosphate transferase